MSALTTRLLGKRLAAVLTNGHLLQICTHEGDELEIAWLDDNGVPLKGRPALVKAGTRLHAAHAVRDVINGPQLTRHGVSE